MRRRKYKRKRKWKNKGDKKEDITKIRRGKTRVGRRK